MAELVRLGFLITSLRPPMTMTDALGHVTRELRAAGAHEIPEMAGLLEQLEALHRDLAAHNAAEPEHQGAMRERLSMVVTEIPAEGRTPLCLDLRLDAEVMLPERVGQEMAVAASALIRLHLARAGPPASGGLLEGTSGIQRAQNDLPRTGGEPPAWDACLLLTL